ncbi:hypothetical protein WHZ77_06025 [Bradyrhizobium sp. A5]|uniref:hypothetical protein n=1 Tax=Bradyrhizobium sp. A5 TaxID=3133696 RepID=UPI0032564509
MNEKFKTPADDLTALPPSEFGPRGYDSPNVGCEGMPSDPAELPIMTVEQVRERIAATVLVMEALKLSDGETSYINRAIDLVREAYCNVTAHSAGVIARDMCDEVQYRAAAEYRR